nr:unnamed protein product [Timema bartmani]
MKDGQITNNQSIVASLPTIKYALSKGAKSVILLSHLGRPRGNRDMKYTLEPVATELKKLLHTQVKFVEDCVGPNVKLACESTPDGSVILLENLRFHLEEEGKGVDIQGNKVEASPDAITNFREALHTLGDIYVNDAFSAAHLSHSSMLGEGFGVRVGGLLLKKELEYFALHKPAKPFLAIIGGTKVTEKVKLIENLLDKVDDIIIGGGLAYTFLKQIKGIQIGDSFFDKDGARAIQHLMGKAVNNGVRIHLPEDFVIADEMAEEANVEETSLSKGIPNGWMALDIGTKSIYLFKLIIDRSKTIIWNGSLGMSELETFSKGTKEIMDAVGAATAKGVITILVGVEIASCCVKWGAEDKVNHLSPGDGANLELLEGKVLPGISALSDW